MCNGSGKNASLIYQNVLAADFPMGCKIAGFLNTGLRPQATSKQKETIAGEKLKVNSSEAKKILSSDLNDTFIVLIHSLHP